MKLDTNYLKMLKYDEKNLKDIEIEVVSKEEDDIPDDGELSCGIGIKDDKPLTETALKQLCGYLKIPYPFTKQLRAQGRTNVLSYIQRQLSQATLSSVILVSGARSIVSITDEEKLHYKGSDIITINQRMNDALKTSDLMLTELIYMNGELNYILLHKAEHGIENCDSWRWGFIITFSALGIEKPNIQAIVKRQSDVSLTILPAKLYSYPLEYHSDVEERWNAISAFIQNPPQPHFLELKAAITRLKITTASYREIKEARSKLGKLKVDKDDNETLSRINNKLQINHIKKEYNISDLPYTPTKLWYSRASTPLKLFDVYTVVAQEATAAPNSISFELRKHLYMYAGNLLMGMPDLSVEQTPPSISW